MTFAYMYWPTNSELYTSASIFKFLETFYLNNGPDISRPMTF